MRHRDLVLVHQESNRCSHHAVRERSATHWVIALLLLLNTQSVSASSSSNL